MRNALAEAQKAHPPFGQMMPPQCLRTRREAVRNMAGTGLGAAFGVRLRPGGEGGSPSWQGATT